MKVARIHTAHVGSALPPLAAAGPAHPQLHRSSRATATLGAGKMSLRERFDTLEQRFIPAKAAGVNASWQFLLSGEGGGEWWVKISGGKIEVKKGRGPKADVTITATAENYLKIAREEVSPIRAYLTGMIKFDGDKGLAKQFKEFFKEVD